MSPPRSFEGQFYSFSRNHCLLLLDNIQSKFNDEFLQNVDGEEHHLLEIEERYFPKHILFPILVERYQSQSLLLPLYLMYQLKIHLAKNKLKNFTSIPPPGTTQVCGKLLICFGLLVNKISHVSVFSKSTDTAS